MLPLLPYPQEVRVLPGEYRPGERVRAFVSSSGDDALEEHLRGALHVLAGREVEMEREPLPAASGHALAAAADPGAARDLARTAADQMTRPVPALRFCVDGGNMYEPTDGMGRIQAPPEGVASAPGRADAAVVPTAPEAYALVVTEDGIAVAGADRAGLFYGVQTLVQLVRGRAKACPCILIRDYSSQHIRGVHVDMKYAFHTVESIEDLLRKTASMKLNVALFEYEDKFPYDRHPGIVDRKAALSRQDVARLLNTAARHHITVIPLVQTLGHLEFALRHDEMAHLRELPDGHTMICPQNTEAVRFVKDMIDEVLEMHPGLPYLHVGGDETYLLGRCPRCEEVSRERGKIGLYLDHMADICGYVLARGVRPIVWDDMIRGHADQIERLPGGTVLAYWDYGTVRERHGERRVPDELARFYGCEGARAALLPDTLSMFPHFDHYRQCGYDVIGAPCLNAGTLVPCLTVASPNVARWAEKVGLCSGLGTISTSWAVFLTHMDAAWYGVAQTADNTWWWPSVDGISLTSRFSETFFGVPGTDVADAFRAMSVGVGIPSALGRPLNLLTYSYMEDVIHYGGDADARRRLGTLVQGPLDMHRQLVRKLEIVEGDGLSGEVMRQLDYVEPLMASAARKLEAVRPSVRANGQVIDLMLLLTEVKRTRCGHWRLFLEAFAGRERPPTEDTPARARDALARENDLRARFRGQHLRRMHVSDAELLTARMFDGEIALLERLAAGEPASAAAFTTRGPA